MKSAFFAENVVPVCEKGQTSSTDGRKGSCPYLWVNSTSTYVNTYIGHFTSSGPPGERLPAERTRKLPTADICAPIRAN